VIVRRAVVGDEPGLRELRLQALSDAPAAFGSTYERNGFRLTGQEAVRERDGEIEVQMERAVDWRAPE
jgi:hypothetical protein